MNPGFVCITTVLTCWRRKTCASNVNVDNFYLHTHAYLLSANVELLFTLIYPRLTGNNNNLLYVLTSNKILREGIIKRSTINAIHHRLICIIIKQNQYLTKIQVMLSQHDNKKPLPQSTIQKFIKYNCITTG